MQPTTCLSVFFSLVALGLSVTFAHPSHASSSPPANLFRRVNNRPSRALSDCNELSTGHGPGDNYADWVFQQSYCVHDDPWQNPRHYRKYHIDCRAPGVPSMLQGPVPWHRAVYTVNECSSGQICVDGPYTPPNPLMVAQYEWYKRHGTAHCVELQHFVHLGKDAAHVKWQEGQIGGAAGQFAGPKG